MSYFILTLRSCQKRSSDNSFGLGKKEDMEAEDGNGRGGRESDRQEPWEPIEGSVTAHDSSKIPDRKGDGKGQEDGGCESGHGSILSGS
jgi:hypothetical protein